MIGAWKPRPPAPSVEERIEALETRMGLLATSLQDFGWRLAQLDRERLDELKLLRQDVDDARNQLQAQVTVNQDVRDRLRVLDRAVGALLATKEPPPDEVFPTAPSSMVAAARTLVTMGWTWHGGQLWKPPLGKPPRFFGDSEGGAA